MRHHRDGSVSRENRDNRDDGSYQRDRTSGQHEQRQAETYRDNDNRRNDGYRNNDNRRNEGYRNNETYRNDARRNDSRRNDGYRNERKNDRYRNNDRRYQSYERYNASRHYRNNDRIRMSGRIDHYYHDRGGYRVWIVGSPFPIWIPDLYWRSGWHVGINIGLGGVYRDGMLYSDIYDDPYYDDGYGYYAPAYANDYLSGYVDRVDYRSGILWVRDDRSDRVFTVDTRSIDPRTSRIDARDLSRGDRVTFVGTFLRNGVFAAERIDSIDTRY